MERVSCVFFMSAVSTRTSHKYVRVCVYCMYGEYLFICIGCGRCYHYFEWNKNTTNEKIVEKTEKARTLAMPFEYTCTERINSGRNNNNHIRITNTRTQKQLNSNKKKHELAFVHCTNNKINFVLCTFANTRLIGVSYCLCLFSFIC